MHQRRAAAAAAAPPPAARLSALIVLLAAGALVSLPRALATCHISDICPGAKASPPWTTGSNCPGPTSKVIIGDTPSTGSIIVATCNTFGCNCDPCYACGAGREYGGNPSCNDQKKCKDAGGCSARCQNSNWGAKCNKCGVRRRRTLLAANSPGVSTVNCTDVDDYLEFMSLTEADLTTRLSDALCKGGSASGASVGAEFVKAIKDSLDRSSDGVLSCAEYEMLTGRCPFPDKITEVKKFPRPGCKLSKAGKATKKWWNNIIAECYRHPLKVTDSTAPNPAIPATLINGYYQSWSSTWKSVGADTDLANLPAYINVVTIAFAKPDMAYTRGAYALDGTGVQFSAGGPVLRDAVLALKGRQPTTRVLLAVGGATYTDWAGLNAQAIKDFVDDFGLDGVDIDYEPASPGCTTNPAGGVTCATDAESVRVATKLRKALPAGAYLMSVASFHVGAYGEGEFAASKPTDSPYRGVSLALAKSTAGQTLDLVNIMAYDAGNAGNTGFDPKESFRAHKAAWPNANIALGVEVPPEAWGDNSVTLAQVDDLTGYVKDNKGAGMMIWSLQKTPSPGAPGPGQITNRMCLGLSLESCDTPLPAP